MDVVRGPRVLPKGGVAFASPGEALEIRRSLPHGHVSAVLGTLRSVGLEKMLAGGGTLSGEEARLKDLAVAKIVSRVIAPGSELSCPRGLSEAAKRKNARRRTDEGTPVTSWRDPPRHLATPSLDTVAVPINPNDTFTVIATPRNSSKRPSTSST